MAFLKFTEYMEFHLEVWYEADFVPVVMNLKHHNGNRNKLTILVIYE